MTAPVNQPTPDSGDDEVLADLIEQFSARAAAGEPVDVEAFAQEHPRQSDRLRRLLPGVRVLMELEGSGAVAADVTSDQGEQPDGSALGDFRLIREIGRGGMGVVYEAEQVSLRRRVALKVLPFAATMDTRQLQRFRNETLAAASLHHGNIVPVHFVGCERGVHFYAMQFIAGHSLAALLRELRGESGLPGPGKRPAAKAAAGEEAPTVEHRRGAPGAETVGLAGLSTQGPKRNKEYFQSVARLGVQVAEALDYAHERGIVHRDVKPANILLDEHGVPWLTDFGLAHLEQNEASLTMTGDLVGTLRYMSPEQALAKRVVVDHRTDVYSLGATLYELLTLRPAFDGQDRQELLRQVAFEEPTAPRKLDRSIPAELETIVFKAMEKNPAERYAIAQELADDLRHWLEDRPIKARRPSVLHIANKWLRRHKGMAWSAAVLAVAAVVILAVSTAWVWYEKGQKEAALASALTAAEGEKQARQRARAALDEMSSAVIEDWLSRQKELTPEQRTFLERSLAAYQEFAQDTGQDEEARAGVADAYMRVGSIRQRLGQRPQAEEAFRNAHDQYALLAVAAPTSVNYRSGVAASLENQTELLLKTGRLEEAATANHKALAIWKQLADDFPTMLELQKSLANCHNNRAVLLYETGRRDESKAAYGEALRLFQQLVKDAPAVPGYRRALAGNYMNLGVLLNAMGDTKGALVAYGETLALYRRLRADFPTERFYQEWLAVTHHNLGILLMHTDQPQEAEAAYHEALAIQKRLTNDFPTVASYQYELAKSLYNLGNLFKKTHRLQEAEARYTEALAIQKRLVADFPGATDYRQALARSHGDLGFLLATTDRLNKAGRHFRAALALLKQLASDVPIDHGFRQELAETHNNLGEQLRRTGRPHEAEKAFRKAIELRPDYAEAHSNLGLALAGLGKLAEAESALRKAIKLRPDFADFHYNLGLSLADQGKLEEAETAFRKCLRLNADDAEAHCKLGLVLLRRGQFRNAVKKLRRGNELGSRRSGWPSQWAEWLRNAETIRALNARLPALLKGQEQPKDAGERLALAQLCQIHKQLFAASVRWYTEAFDAKPELANDQNAQHRYNAACAAALAGCGQGKDDALDDQERAHLRQQALDWLRADLDAWGKLLKKQPDKVRPTVVKTMRHWRQDNDFAGVRGDEAIGKLPEGERQAWHKLWADVAHMLANAER
jgi:serine/threonine protein kinase/Tfp pilus assembly protein PilF